MSCIQCNECKYCVDNFYCDHPNTYTNIDYVTCKKSQDYRCCNSWRTGATPHSICGEEAKWFEQKSIETKKPWWIFWN